MFDTLCLTNSYKERTAAKKKQDITISAILSHLLCKYVSLLIRCACLDCCTVFIFFPSLFLMFFFLSWGMDR